MRRNQGKKGEKKRKEKLAIGAPPNIHCWLASSQKKSPTKKNSMEPRKATIRANNTPYAATRS